MTAHKAPPLELNRWVQGDAIEIHANNGRITLLEIFQVNCPGCFAHALPEAARLHESYTDAGLDVIGIATAFEEFEMNTEDSLLHLLDTGEVRGAPRQQLGKAGYLNGDCLPYTLPFSIALDRLVVNTDTLDKHAIEGFILQQIPDFHEQGMADEQKQAIWQQATTYLASKTHKALTFEAYQCQGTPTSIVIDQQGVIQLQQLGIPNAVEPVIKQLLTS